MLKPITLLIGHRGVGKSTFLKNLAALFPALCCLDLDDEIAIAAGASVGEIFARGEAAFRVLERETLARLLAAAKSPTVIALGAGYEGPPPVSCHVLWLRRVTDAAGRSFLKRPRLNAAVSPFDEYGERFAGRDRRFREWCHEELHLPEGSQARLEDFLTDAWRVPFDLTVLPENFRSWDGFLKKRMDWGVRRWEIRDDLLTPEQLECALATIPRANLLFSRRRRDGSAPALELKTDWALELGAPPVSAEILSRHERESDFATTLRSLPAADGKILKLAIEVRDFSELKAGHDWWLADPHRRAFLPRSAGGRWRWYRSLFGPQMPIHFVREGEGSGLDQPFLWQCRLQCEMAGRFAAVLGQPIDPSFSPMEQREFFASLGVPFVGVEVGEAEFPTALRVLEYLGLRFAAVTAPLKRAAFAAAGEKSSEAQSTQSANTLHWRGDRIAAHNTDVLALRELRREMPQFGSIFLWGGGGVKGSVQAVWPEAVELSARTGLPTPEGAGLVIWAVGRRPGLAAVPAGVRPALVFDLNYTDDSPGLEWAVRENLPYQSGLKMFKLQAEFQRRFWGQA